MFPIALEVRLARIHRACEICQRLAEFRLAQIGDNLGGLTVLADVRFQIVPLPQGWPAKPILRLAAAEDGAVWAMNDEGTGTILPLTNGVAGEPLAATASPITLATDSRGEVWAAVAGRLCRLDSKQGVIPIRPGPEVVKDWQAVFPAIEGGLWIVDDGWLRRWNDGSWVEDRGRSDWGATKQTKSNAWLSKARCERRWGVV